jgi:hypothetical protein
MEARVFGVPSLGHDASLDEGRGKPSVNDVGVRLGIARPQVQGEVRRPARSRRAGRGGHGIDRRRSSRDGRITPSAAATTSRSDALAGKRHTGGGGFFQTKHKPAVGATQRPFCLRGPSDGRCAREFLALAAIADEAEPREAEQHHRPGRGLGKGEVVSNYLTIVIKSRHIDGIRSKYIDGCI